jgi:signal transduction histidine kinase
VAVILQDVTRFRLLDEIKTNLVSTVSHELKTPLTSVRMGCICCWKRRLAPSIPSKRITAGRARRFRAAPAKDQRLA